MLLCFCYDAVEALSFPGDVEAFHATSFVVPLYAAYRARPCVSMVSNAALATFISMAGATCVYITVGKITALWR